MSIVTLLGIVSTLSAIVMATGGYKLLNFLLLKIVKNVSTLDPSSAIFLLKNYACAFTKAKKTEEVQSF
jgi:hypothetical protein